MAKVVLTRWDEEPDLPRQEIVEGLFAAGEVVLLTGKPKSGKSAVAVALAGAIATGQPFLGRSVEQGDVVYFALERRQSVRRRFKVLGLPPASPVWMPRGSLSVVEDAVAIIDGILGSERVPEVIIFDTLARSITGMDENSARDMGVVAKAIAQIGEAFPATAIVFIHHTTKEGDTARGSNALLGAVDLEIRAQIHGKAQGGLRVAHANDVAEDQRLQFQLDPVALPDGGIAIRAIAPTTGGKAAIMNHNAQASANAQDRALAALPHLPTEPFTQAEAVRLLTEARIVDGTFAARKKNVQRMMDRLIESGHVTDQGGKLMLKDAA
jgi:hypothetical protein